jgi:lauroyl/myristoyl acyltransferase
MPTVSRFLRGRMRALRFFILLLLARLAALLGWRSLRPIGKFLGTLHFAVNRSARRQLSADMAAALGVTPAQAARALLSAYRVNDRALFEIVALPCPWLRVEPLIDACEIVGLASLQQHVATRQGAMLVGMHMGNGILMAGALAARGLPVAVVYRESGKIPAGYLGLVMVRIGVEPLRVTHDSGVAEVRAILRALRAGRLVFVLMDQAAKHDGIPVDFLGKRLKMSGGIVRLAVGSGVPIIPVLLREAEPRWRFSVEPAMCASGDVEQDVRAVARLMEAHIQAHPGYWSWHHRRWRRYRRPDRD